MLLYNAEGYHTPGRALGMRRPSYRLHFVEPLQPHTHRRFLIIIVISFIIRQTTVHTYVTRAWTGSSVSDAIAVAVLADQFGQRSFVAARTFKESS
jgi:hypothetical protein